MEGRNSLYMVIRERMLSLPTERTALFLPQITVFTGQHENSPQLGGICLAAVNKNTFRQKKTKQNKKKKPRQASILFDNRNIESCRQL